MKKSFLFVLAFAGISIILAAVYMLNMIQKVFYGSPNTITDVVKPVTITERIILALIVVIIFIVGIFPQPLLDLTKETVSLILGRIK